MERISLYLGPTVEHDAIESSLADMDIEFEPADRLLGDPATCADAAVLVVDESIAREHSDLAGLPEHVVVVAADSAAADILGSGADLALVDVTDGKSTETVLRAALLLADERRRYAAARADLDRTIAEVNELTRIGKGLMMQRDRRALLHEILDKAMEMTVSDAGAVFLIDETSEGPRLVFKVLLCRSQDISRFKSYTVPIDSTSLPGYAVLTRKPLVTDDAHDLPESARYWPTLIVNFGDEYWIKSMLTVPMIGQRDNVVGVLALANRKSDAEARLGDQAAADRWVIPYTKHDVELGFSLAGQAAIAIETVYLINDLEQSFDSFVKASVIAIDQRDPTTAGHSMRVAMLTTDLGAALERVDHGPYRDARLTNAQMEELRYAALLHDFGKIGVREDVLVKPKKLPAVSNERVDARFNLIRCTISLNYQKERARLLEAGSDPAAHEELERRYNCEISQLDHFWTAIRAANEPVILTGDMDRMLGKIARHTFEREDGVVEPYLTPDELHYLRVPYGTLDEDERLEIQSHAARTFDYLSHISWRDGLRDIPRYASAHHEKLNGSGYPRHITAVDIPVQTRIITIADIFDALTASDRPYKRAVSADEALDIIKLEAKAGLLDADLVDIMIDGQFYRRILEEDWRTF